MPIQVTLMISMFFSITKKWLLPVYLKSLPLKKINGDMAPVILQKKLNGFKINL